MNRHFTKKEIRIGNNNIKISTSLVIREKQMKINIEVQFYTYHTTTHLKNDKSKG